MKCNNIIVNYLTELFLKQISDKILEIKVIYKYNIYSKWFDIDMIVILCIIILENILFFLKYQGFELEFNEDVKNDIRK